MDRLSFSSHSKAGSLLTKVGSSSGHTIQGSACARCSQNQPISCHKPKPGNKENKTMEDLIVVTYDNEYKAQDTINTLRSLNDNWIVNLYDAVAVTRDVNGKLNVEDSYQMTSGEGAGWGVLWGTLIGGLIFAPFTGGLSAAAAASAVGAGAVTGAALGGLTGAATASLDKDDFGLSEDFV